MHDSYDSDAMATSHHRCHDRSWASDIKAANPEAVTSLWCRSGLIANAVLTVGFEQLRDEATIKGGNKEKSSKECLKQAYWFGGTLGSHEAMAKATSTMIFREKQIKDTHSLRLPLFEVVSSCCSRLPVSLAKFFKHLPEDVYLKIAECSIYDVFWELWNAALVIFLLNVCNHW